MASVVQKYIKAYRMYGWRETLNKMYSVRVLPSLLPPSIPPSFHTFPFLLLVSC